MRRKTREEVHAIVAQRLSNHSSSDAWVVAEAVREYKHKHNDKHAALNREIASLRAEIDVLWETIDRMEGME